MKKKEPDKLSPFHQLIGRTLDDVQTLGKELFMYFGDLCLRIHFLMAGQSFINNQKVDNDLGGKAETATLELLMSTDLLTFRNSSADMRLSEPCRKKYDDLNEVDVCSPVFNFKRAVAMVMEQQDRLVCDVLLDQGILPGVGNIIKNEALFDSGIKPSSKVSELKQEHVTHLVKMTRDFTNIFYQCRRDGKPLHVHYKVYGKKRCKQCDGKVTICRLGEDNDRVTYFCETCQTNDLKNNQRRLPVKNSLLGWVTTDTGSQPPAQWTCRLCTLDNPGNQTNCNACLTPRHAEGNKGTSVNQTSNTMKPQSNKRPNESVTKVSSKNSSSSNNSSSVMKKRQSLDSDNFSTEGQPSKVRKLSNSKSSGSSSSAAADSGVQGKGGSRQPLQARAGDQEEGTSKIPLCPTHNRKCNLREVHKKGDNYGRWFFSCGLRTCNFFEWADLKFPICPDHGKPCTLRTVMKIGPNNGKKFFACKMPKNKQCKFFEWAVGYG